MSRRKGRSPSAATPLRRPPAAGGVGPRHGKTPNRVELSTSAEGDYVPTRHAAHSAPALYAAHARRCGSPRMHGRSGLYAAITAPQALKLCRKSGAQRKTKTSPAWMS
jgi:hypothetical protein